MADEPVLTEEELPDSGVRCAAAPVLLVLLLLVLLVLALLLAGCCVLELALAIAALAAAAVAAAGGGALVGVALVVGDTLIRRASLSAPVRADEASKRSTMPRMTVA